MQHYDILTDARLKIIETMLKEKNYCDWVDKDDIVKFITKNKLNATLVVNLLDTKQDKQNRITHYKLPYEAINKYIIR